MKIEDPFQNQPGGKSNSESGDKPLPDNIKKKVRELREAAEGKRGAPDKKIDDETVKIHEWAKEQDRDFLDMLVEGIRQSGKENSEAAILALEKDFAEYAKCQDEVFEEKGANMSANDIRLRLSPDNLFVRALLKHGKDILKKEIN